MIIMFVSSSIHKLPMIVKRNMGEKRETTNRSRFEMSTLPKNHRNPPAPSSLPLLSSPEHPEAIANDTEEAQQHTCGVVSTCPLRKGSGPQKKVGNASR